MHAPRSSVRYRGDIMKAGANNRKLQEGDLLSLLPGDIACAQCGRLGVRYGIRSRFPAARRQRDCSCTWLRIAMSARLRRVATVDGFMSSISAISTLRFSS